MEQPGHEPRVHFEPAASEDDVDMPHFGQARRLINGLGSRLHRDVTSSFGVVQ